MVSGETLLELTPGVGVDIFKLGARLERLPVSSADGRPGDSLWHILDILRAHRDAYSKVRLLWDHSVSRYQYMRPLASESAPAVERSSQRGHRPAAIRASSLSGRAKRVNLGLAASSALAHDRRC